MHNRSTSQRRLTSYFKFLNEQKKEDEITDFVQTTIKIKGLDL